MPRQNVDNIEMNYELFGEGEPLVFIHGLGSSLRDWEPQRAFFAENYQILLFDVRGHGHSGKPKGPYTVKQFAQDLAGLIDSLSISSAHIVGISMGGMIAFQLAVIRPELVKSLVIVNSGPELLVRTFKERFSIWQRFLIVRLLGMRKMGEVLSPRLFPKSEHAEIRQTFVQRWSENDPRAYRSAMAALVNWSVADSLDTISCPTLFIASDQDYTPVALKEKYAARMPNAELTVIEDAHHAVTTERPEAFNAVLADFLRQNSVQ